jgi:hypothetical protein
MPITLAPISLSPRGRPRAPDLFAITMRVSGCTFPEAVAPPGPCRRFGSGACQGRVRRPAVNGAQPPFANRHCWT